MVQTLFELLNKHYLLVVGYFSFNSTSLISWSHFPPQDMANLTLWKATIQYSSFKFSISKLLWIYPYYQQSIVCTKQWSDWEDVANSTTTTETVSWSIFGLDELPIHSYLPEELLVRSWIKITDQQMAQKLIHKRSYLSEFQRLNKLYKKGKRETSIDFMELENSLI